jgi:predicted DNA-binding ribbon-helix-helix protein
LPYFTLDMDPLDVDTNGIAENQTTAGAADLDLDGAQVVDGVWDIHAVPTTAYSEGVGGVRIAIDSAGDVSSVVFTVYGTDQDGIARTETITGVTTSAVNSVTFWQTITRIAADAAVGSNVFVGAIDQIVSETLPLNWRNNYSATFVVDITGTLQYDIEESNSEMAAYTDPVDLVWGVTQSNQTADLTGSCLNYTTAARVRWDSYSSGAEMQFSLRQNDYR